MLNPIDEVLARRETRWPAGSRDLHVLVITDGSILLVGCDVQLRPAGDRNVLVIRHVSSTNLGAFLSHQFGSVIVHGRNGIEFEGKRC